MPEGRCISLGNPARVVLAVHHPAVPDSVAPPERAHRTEAATGSATAALWLLLKRAVDAVLALVALAVLAPCLLVIMAAVKLDSPGPVFYRVRRVGYRGQPLRMLKFRKMHEDAAGGPLTTSGDPRLTRVGAVLTRCRLDELPQLWHVLTGEMSIVGPRPEDPAFVALHAERYERILSVRPGITGLSQIAYKEESEIVDGDSPVEDYLSRIMPQKLLMDTLYASACSPRFDLAILRWTLVTMVFRLPVSVNRRTGKMRIRRRPAPLLAPALAAAPAPVVALPGVPVMPVASPPVAEMAMVGERSG